MLLILFFTLFSSTTALPLPAPLIASSHTVSDVGEFLQLNPLNTSLSLPSPSQLPPSALSIDDASPRTMGLRFVPPPPPPHKFNPRNMPNISIMEMKELVVDIIDELKRDDSALNAMDGAIVAQINKMEGAEKAFAGMEKAVSRMNGSLQAEISRLKAALDEMEARVTSLRRALVAEWEKIDNVRVRVHIEAKTWDDALAFCRQFPADLVHVSSAIMNKKIADLIEWESADAFWIGAEGSSVVEATGFNKFAPPERVCMTVGRKGVWTSRPCLTKLPFICSFNDNAF